MPMPARRQTAAGIGALLRKRLIFRLICGPIPAANGSEPLNKETDACPGYRSFNLFEVLSGIAFPSPFHHLRLVRDSGVWVCLEIDSPTTGNLPLGPPLA